MIWVIGSTVLYRCSLIFSGFSPMARPNQEATDAFINITGAPEAVAVRKVDEHRGDLIEAVNAYLGEGDRNIDNETPVIVTEDDAMDMEDAISAVHRESTMSLLSAARAMSPFPLLDSNFGRSFFVMILFLRHVHRLLRIPREVRQIPVEVKDSSEPSSRSGNAPAIEDVTGIVHDHEPGTRGMVIIDEEIDEDIHAPPTGQSRHARPSAPAADNIQEYNDIEEEMIQAALGASKKDAERSRNPSLGKAQSHLEDDDIEQAVARSLKSAEE